MTLSKTKSLLSGASSNSHANSYNVSSINGHAQNYQECADCGSSNAQWASLNHGVVICDECCLVHRSLGRCVSIIKSLKKSYWPQSLIDTLYELVRKNSNQIWESNLNNSNENKHISLSFKSIKKPTPKDSSTNKMNFIKMKYENLAFLSRGKYTSIEELNQQLFASVKTNNFEQTLRILSQGADSNYRNQEDGNYCLHAAVLANQIGQIELLCLYGAEVTCMDRNSLTPYEIAKALNNQHIADRLVELQFELTDEISYFLCNKRPDHKTSKSHFLIPDISECNSQLQEDTTRSTKFKLQELPDHLFDELSKDIYDELDRRQIELIWKCTVGPNLINEPIPFLVIKSCFTQTRNQLRQKLARFSSSEFSSLLVEILIETKDRYDKLERLENAVKNKNGEGEESEIENEQHDEEEDPLYDRVPSDEDYASVASEPSCSIPVGTSNEINNAASLLMSKSKSPPINSGSYFNKITTPLKVNTALSPVNYHSAFSQKSSKSNTNNQNSPASISSNTNRSHKNATPSPASGTRFSSKEHKILTTNFDKPHSHFASPSLVANAESTLNSMINNLNQIDYSHLSSRDETSPSQINEKFSTSLNLNIDELRSENELMQSMIERLMEENAQLRAEKMLLTSSVNNKNENYMNDNLYSTVKNKYLTKDPYSYDQHLSFKKDENNYENFSYAEKNSNGIKSLEILNEMNDSQKKFQSQNSPSFNTTKTTTPAFQKKLNKKDSAADHSGSYFKISPSGTSINAISKMPLGPAISSSLSTNTNASSIVNTANGKSMPSKDSVIKKMKKITKAVQELFRATKESDFGALKELCEKVNICVHEMIILFPQQQYALMTGPLQENLKLLEDTCTNLVELIYKNYTQIELFIHDASLNDANGEKKHENSKTATHQITMSGSSSSSSAISSGSGSDQDSMVLKTMIVSNLVTYSYEIAHTVKRIVCIMDAD